MPAQLRVVFKDGKQLGPKVALQWQKHSLAVRKAFALTAQQAATEIEDLGRSDIQGAGNFGSRWTEGFKAKVTAGGGRTLIRVTMGVPYWSVFQTGKVIHGKPLLWIPLSFADDAKGVSARDYPGKLFRVDRKSGGAPLLMTNSGGQAQAKYFGKESVTIPKKFHLIEIVRAVARTLKKKYRANRRASR